MSNSQPSDGQSIDYISSGLSGLCAIKEESQNVVARLCEVTPILRSNVKTFRFDLVNKTDKPFYVYKLEFTKPDDAIVKSKYSQFFFEENKEYRKLCKELSMLAEEFYLAVHSVSQESLTRYLAQALRASVDDMAADPRHARLLEDLDADSRRAVLRETLERNLGCIYRISGPEDALAFYSSQVQPCLEDNAASGFAREFAPVFLAKYQRLRAVADSFTHGRPCIQLDPNESYTMLVSVRFNRGYFLEQSAGFVVEYVYSQKAPAIRQTVSELAASLPSASCAPASPPHAASPGDAPAPPHDQETAPARVEGLKTGNISLEFRVTPRSWSVSLAAVAFALLGLSIRMFLIADGSDVKPGTLLDRFGKQGLTAMGLAFVIFNIFEFTDLRKKVTFGINWRSAMIIGLLCGLASKQLFEVLKVFLPG